MSENALTNMNKGGQEEPQIDENDRMINSIQEMRHSFIRGLAPDGLFPKDKDDRDALIAIMGAATSTAMGNKKIKSAEKTSTSQLSVIQTLAEAVRIGRSTQSAAHRQGLQDNRVIPVVPITVVPGHTDIGCFPISTTSIANGGDGKIDQV